MLLIEKIQADVQKLPEHLQREVLDLVEFLLAKSTQDAERQDELVWSNAVMAYTMQRMDEDEGDDAPVYTLDDLKKRY